jgi:hypothetical protein
MGAWGVGSGPTLSILPEFSLLSLSSAPSSLAASPWTQALINRPWFSQLQDQVLGPSLLHLLSSPYLA